MLDELYEATKNKLQINEHKLNLFENNKLDYNAIVEVDQYRQISERYPFEDPKCLVEIVVTVRKLSGYNNN